MSVPQDLIVAIKNNFFFKIACLLTIFPVFCATIGVDRWMRGKNIRNPFLRGIPRDTDELRANKASFFKFLQKHAVKDLCSSTGRSEPMIPADAVMVYMDVKDGTPAEPEKNRGVACIDVAFRVPTSRRAPSSVSSGEALTPHDVTDTMNDAAVSTAVQNFSRHTTTGPDGTEVTVLRIFVKMSTSRSWPVPFKAIISTFTSSVKEVDVFTNFMPMLQDYCNASGVFKNTTKFVSESPKAHSHTTTDGLLAPPSFPRAENAPAPVPLCHLATWSRVFDRSLSVFDCIDTRVWRPIADYQTVTEPHLIALVTSIAKVHAITVGRVGHFASRYNPEMLTMSPNDRKIFDGVCSWSTVSTATGWLQSILDAFEQRLDDPVAAKKFAELRKSGGSDLLARLGLDGAPLPAGLTAEQFDALNDGKVFRRVWAAVCKRLEREVTCVSHCDCRPGNMLFCGGGGGLNPSKDSLPASVENDSAPQNVNTDSTNVRHSLPDEDDENAKRYAKADATVVHLDWEACCLSPLLFDVAYIIGGRLERRRYETVLLKAYLASLREGVERRLDRDGVTDATKRERVLALCVPEFEAAHKTVKIMYMLQGYFAWVLEQFGGVGIAQGNSQQDSESWAARGRNLWLSMDPESLAADIGHGLAANDLRVFRYLFAEVPELEKRKRAQAKAV